MKPCMLHMQCYVIRWDDVMRCPLMDSKHGMFRNLIKTFVVIDPLFYHICVLCSVSRSSYID